METIYFVGKDKDRLWELLNDLRENGKPISGEWHGDFFVSVYEMGDKVYTYEEDMDLGVPYSITMQGKGE